MVQIDIMDISKTPSIINSIDEVAKIVNKKTKQIKGYFIPAMYEDIIKKVIEEIEYQNFRKRNINLANDDFEDDTLQDGYEIF